MDALDSSDSECEDDNVEEEKEDAVEVVEDSVEDNN